MPAMRLGRRTRVALAIFVISAAVYVATLGSRLRGGSDNAHFVYLAQSFLHGQLALVGNHAPGDNDWAFYRGHWFVSFPPFPALVIAPLVALFGTAVWDRLFWAICAGVAPALLYLLLEHLRERGLSQRSTRDNLALTALFAFGSPFYYTAVQGTVWFAAHVVACALGVLFLLAAMRAERPLLAGTILGMSFMTRPTTLWLGLVFVCEALATARKSGAPEALALRDLLREIDRRVAARRLVLFALPLLLTLALAMWMNYARFHDAFEFGHSYLRIRWSARIETWGLVNYHYLGRNLAVFLAALPWLQATVPYLRISRHGLALWFTTPPFALVLWPRQRSLTLTALGLAAFAVALLDLCYQNSGWIQFAYRFSLDYAVLLIAMLALGGRPFGKGFYALLAFSIVINLFGAITFDRSARFYDSDPTQQVIFQPD